MRKYRIKAASPIRIDYGIGLVAGLRYFPQTKAFAGAFEELNNDLDGAHTMRRSKRKPLVEARMAVKFGNYEVDQCIRSLSRAVEIADGGRRGMLHAGLFPDGLEAVVAPAGIRQIKPTEQLIDRVERCKLDGIEPLRKEWLPKLQAALAILAKAAADYKTAADGYANAFKYEVGLRDEHYLAVDKLAGLVRAAFPGNRAKQDLVFPVVDDGGESDAVEDEDSEGDGTGEPK